MIGKTNVKTKPKYKVDNEQLINYTMLYDCSYNDIEKNQCIDITSGWTSGNCYTYSDGVFSLSKNGMYYGDAGSGYGSKYAGTNNKIDMTEYSSIFCKMENTYNPGSTYNVNINANFPGEKFTIGSSLYIDSVYGGKDCYNRGFKTYYAGTSAGTELISITANFTKDINRFSHILLWGSSIALGPQILTSTCYYLAILKQDDWKTLANIAGITANSIDDILTNSEILLSNKIAVEFMLIKCTGIFMANAIVSETFLTALNNSQYKTIIMANEHWSKFLSIVA